MTFSDDGHAKAIRWLCAMIEVGHAPMIRDGYLDLATGPRCLRCSHTWRLAFGEDAGLDGFTICRGGTP